MASDLEFVEFVVDQCDEELDVSGAKPSFSIGDRVEDGAWLSELIGITAGELRSS